MWLDLMWLGLTWLGLTWLGLTWLGTVTPVSSGSVHRRGCCAPGG
jgi:hypothetical protein